MGRSSARLRQATKADVAEVVAWYRHEAPEQVRRFREDLRQALETIEAHPYLCPERLGPVQLHAMRVFPYGIWYVVDEKTETVQVLAILHFKRDPATVAQRLGDGVPGP